MRRLARDPTDGGQQDTEENDADDKQGRLTRRRHDNRRRTNEARVDGDYQPSLPSGREAPTPTVSLGWKPVSRLLRHGEASRAASYADHRIRRGRKLVQDIRAVLLIGSTIRELYCPKAMSLVEATGARVCLESVEENRPRQDKQGVRDLSSTGQAPRIASCLALLNEANAL